METIYTIGHSLHSHSHFLSLLSKHKINCVIDVRSVPYSKYAPQYNTNGIKHFLKSNGIFYIFMGEEFGARQTDKSLFSSEGYLDFEKVMKSNLFKTGIERVKNGLSKGFNVTIMCTEKDPLDCHRSILVARSFYRQKFNILNILEDGRTETQEQLEERLLNLYFPDRNQKTLIEFLEGEKSRNDLVERAYQFRNKDIGYREKINDGSIVV